MVDVGEGADIAQDEVVGKARLGGVGVSVDGGDGDAVEVLGVLVFRFVFAEMLRGARRVEKLLCAGVKLRVLFLRVEGPWHTRSGCRER